jgi:hypothetical protein
MGGGAGWWPCSAPPTSSVWPKEEAYARFTIAVYLAYGSMASVTCSPPRVGTKSDGGLRAHYLSRLGSGPKASARLGLEGSAGWASPSSRGVWGGDALLLSTEIS